MSEKIEIAKSLLSFHDFHFYFSTEWGSSHPHSRQKMQERIDELLQKNTVSISHTDKMGGFIIFPNSVQMGLDMEEVLRVKASTIARVSNETELAKAPSPASLWVAKEASFKAMKGPHQPKVLSQIEVENWKNEKDLETLILKIP